MPQEILGDYSEWTLGRIELHLEVIHDLEGLFQMREVPMWFFWFYQDVINIYLHNLSKMIGKHFIHQSLVNGPSVL